MKVFGTICGMACTMLLPEGAIAETTKLQTVNLNDRNMSAEGGEARLYRVDDPRRSYCRIEANHYGETGKAIYAFDFASKLFAAERREYRYEVPIQVDPNPRQSLTERITLATPQGRRQLSRYFQEYRSFFDPARLAECSGR